MILPRPAEIRTLRAPGEEMMMDRMPWMQRQSHLQGRVDHRLHQALRDRGTACNHGHLVMPDYIVPGYTGKSNSLAVITIIFVFLLVHLFSTVIKGTFSENLFYSESQGMFNLKASIFKVDEFLEIAPAILAKSLTF